MPTAPAPSPASPTTPDRSRLARWGVFFPLLAMLTALGARALLVATNPEFASEPGAAAALVVQSDAVLIAAACLLLWVSLHGLSRRLLPLARVALAGFIVLYSVDVMMVWCMETRLSWGRLTTFAPLPDVVVGFLMDRFGVAGVALIALTALTLIGGLLFAPWRRPRYSHALLAGGVALGAFGLWRPMDPDHLPRWMRENVVALNTPNPQRKRYSPAEEERLTAAYRQLPVRTLAPAAPDRRNVILLIVESWSSYHSAAFDGVLDWTPELDALARANTRFTRFHAGGYCTAEGLVNLLGGVRLWVPYGKTSQLDQLPSVASQRDTLPAVFRRAGYFTRFMTTGTLDFVGKGPWLTGIGYEQSEGSEHPFYNGWPRIAAFDAAHDEALYKRTLQWLADRPADRPFFLTLETVSSHIPYLDPDSHRINIEACFRYTDRWAGWFVRELEQRGFFEDGILVITSDHRAMTPTLPAEKRAFGLGLSSRVPLVIVDRRRPDPQVIDAVYKQADLVPSFRHWLGESVTLDALSASLFEAGGHPENVALHRRDREVATLDVFFSDGEGQVKMTGDATDFLWAKNLSAERRARVLALIAHERLTVDADTMPAGAPGK